VSANLVPPTIMPVRTDRKRRNRPGHSALRHTRTPAWRDIMGGSNPSTRQWQMTFAFESQLGCNADAPSSD
jgi:hypothetical protein